MSTIIDEIERASKKKEVPDFRPGDTVSVHVKVTEGNKERTQVFTGVVIQRRGGGLAETFTVRKISQNIPVERIFPLHSPHIQKIKVDSKGQVHQSRIFYLRKLRGKAARIKSR